MSLLEGMAVGCVPVASRIDAGYRAFVHDGTTGLLVPPGDIRGFGEALLRLDKDRDLLATLSTNARAAARVYGVARMCDSYVDLFRDIGALR